MELSLSLPFAADVDADDVAAASTLSPAAAPTEAYTSAPADSMAPSAAADAADSMAAPASPSAPVPVVRPILRGRIVEAPAAAVGAGAAAAAAGTTYAWEGRWAMAENDVVWSDFRYTFRISSAQPAPAAAGSAGGAVPAHLRLPSSPEHPPVGAPMAGYFMMAGPEGKSAKHTEPKVLLRLGGTPPPDAPEEVTLADGSVVTAMSGGLLGVRGEGAFAGNKYALAGVYHPPTGTAWVRKVYAVAAASRPKPPPSVKKERTTPQAAAAAAAAAALGTAGAASAAASPSAADLGPREKRQVC